MPQIAGSETLEKIVAGRERGEGGHQVVGRMEEEALPPLSLSLFLSRPEERHNRRFYRRHRK